MTTIHISHQPFAMNSNFVYGTEIGSIPSDPNKMLAEAMHMAKNIGATEIQILSPIPQPEQTVNKYSNQGIKIIWNEV